MSRQMRLMREMYRDCWSAVFCQIYPRSGNYIRMTYVTGLLLDGACILVGALVGWEVVALTSFNFFSGSALKE